MTSPSARGEKSSRLWRLKAHSRVRIWGRRSFTELLHSHMDRGATSAEYALLAALVAGVIAGTVALIGPALVPAFLDAAKGI